MLSLVDGQERPSGGASFFDGCLDAANTGRDIDFYHWPSQSFGGFWKGAFCSDGPRACAGRLVRGSASKGDWSRRIAAYARGEQEDAAAYADS